MHKQLHDFFTTNRTATREKKRAAHDQLGPLMAMCDDVVAYVNDLQSKLTVAELAAHDHGIDNTLNWMHTRLAAAVDRTAAFRAAGRALAQVLVEVEAGFEQSQIDAAAVLSRNAEKASAPMRDDPPA